MVRGEERTVWGERGVVAHVLVEPLVETLYDERGGG